jgi:BirA family biotin operon repressor/biotin-[acetyl-CoA-carboxylase] ligase
MLDSDLQHFLSHSGRTYLYLATTASTQDELRALEARGAAEGSVVVAEAQTAGRGRRGRVWQSRPGSSLTFSLLLRPGFVLEHLSLLPFAAAVALREAVGLGGLKWPNDLLSPDRRKMAGILVEAAIRPSAVAVYMGVGLNVKSPTPEGAAALEEFGECSRVQILQWFLNRFAEQYHKLHTNPAEVLERWRSFSYTLDQAVSLRTPSGIVSGIARDLAEDGGLMVESEGQLLKVSAGDVALIGYIGEQP